MRLKKENEDIRKTHIGGRNKRRKQPKHQIFLLNPDIFYKKPTSKVYCED